MTSVWIKVLENARKNLKNKCPQGQTALTIDVAMLEPTAFVPPAKLIHCIFPVPNRDYSNCFDGSIPNKNNAELKAIIRCFSTGNCTQRIE